MAAIQRRASSRQRRHVECHRLQNVGVDDYMLRKLPPMKKYPGCKVIVNVFGSTVSEYIQSLSA